MASVALLGFMPASTLSLFLSSHLYIGGNAKAKLLENFGA